MPTSLLPDTGTEQAAHAPARLSLRFSHHAQQRLAERTSMTIEDADRLLHLRRVRTLQCFGSSGIQMLLAYDARQHQFCVLVVGVSTQTVITVLTYEQALQHGWASTLAALQKRTLHALARESGEQLITFDRRDDGRLVEARMKVYATFVDLADPCSKLEHRKVGRLAREDLHLHSSGVVAIKTAPKREELVIRTRAFVSAAPASRGFVCVMLTDKSGTRHRLERLPNVETVDLDELNRRARWSDLPRCPEAKGVSDLRPVRVGGVAGLEMRTCS